MKKGSEHGTGIKPEEGWELHSKFGFMRTRLAGSPQENVNLVRLADVVKWAMTTQEVSLGSAVGAVQGYLRPEFGGLDECFVLSEIDVPRPLSKARTLVAGGLLALRVSVNAKGRIDQEIRWDDVNKMLNFWLKSRAVLDRDMQATPDAFAPIQGDESAFAYSERLRLPPSRLAISWRRAHQLWNWGTADAQVIDAEPVSVFPLADWGALVDYRKANMKKGKGPGWGLGNQLAILRAELGQRKSEGQTESAALNDMGWELGYTGAEPRKPLKQAQERDRKRMQPDEAPSPPMVTRVRNGKKVA